MGDADKFPHINTGILRVHSDEVWGLEWSHNGKFLASASKDTTVAIWSVAVCVISTFDALWCLCMLAIS
jgi:WD40 repeat protein